MPDKVKILYDVVSKDYDVGSFDEFQVKLQDDTKRKAFYDGVGAEYELGDFNTFSTKIKKKEPTEVASTSGTQTLKRGFEPFQTPVDTKTPSVLTPKGKTEYQEQVKDYVPPKEVKQPKEEKPDFFESVKNSLSNVGTGVQQFIPNTAIALSETLQGLLGKDLGSDFYRNIVGSANNPELDRQEAYAKLAELEPQFKRTRGLIESAENFDAVGLAAATIDAMSSLVRTAITSVPTAGVGLASDMVGGSIASYNQEKAKSKGISVDELYKRGENEFAIPATIGAIGTGLEAIGLKGTIGLINKKLTGSFAKKFATTFVDVNKEGLTEFLQTGLDASNKALSQGKSVADASKVAVDEMFSKKGLESYLMGVVGSAGSAGVGRVVKGMLPTNKKKATKATQKIAEMESELSNPNISPATQEFIAENIRQNVAEVADVIENDANEVEGLSDDQKFTINSVNEIINSYEEVLSDPNASEQTKKLAQERISGLDLEVDNILQGKKLSPQTQALVESKAPLQETKATDTEEQIAEEQTPKSEVTVPEIEKPKSIRLNFSEEGLAKMEGVKQKDIYPTRQFFKNESNNVGLPDVGSPQFDPFVSENKDNTKEETVDLSEITPTQELVYKSGIGGNLTIGNPKLVRFNDGIFVLDGHHRISTEAVKGNDKIKADVTTIDMTSDEWGEQKINKFLSQQEDVKTGEIEKSNIGEYPRATEQQQREQEDRQYQEEPISQAKTETGGGDSVVESREVEENVIPKEEFATEEEYTLDRVDKENDPEELAALYYEQETPEPDYKTEGIMDYLGSKTRINLRDWNRWNDVNNLTPQLRRRYIDSNNKSGGLDQSAMELSEMLGVEITEEDFIDAILEFGSTKAYKEKGLSKVQKAIADKYYEITGKNLTEGRAERAYLKIKNKPKTDKEIYELNESLQEIGITYEDIERYNEYAKQELEGAEKPIRKTEPVTRTSRKVREEGERVQEVDALKDVEATAKALEGVDKEKGKNLLSGLLNTFTGKDYFYHGTTKDFTNFKKFKKMGVESIETEQPIFLAQSKDSAEPFSNAKGGRLLRVRVAKDAKIFDPDNIITNNSSVEYDYSNLTKEAKELAQAFDRGKIELTLGKLKDKDGYEIITDYIQHGDWDVLESKGVKEWLIKKGYDGVFVREFRNTKDKNLAIFNTDKLIINEPKSIAEAYHKAKADGSNPELLKAVEELLGKITDERKTEEVKRPIETPRVAEPTFADAFTAIEEAKRSKKTQKGKLEVAEQVVKEMGEVGKKAIFIDNNFKEIIAKIKEFKNDKGEPLIKINCQ